MLFQVDKLLKIDSDFDYIDEIVSQPAMKKVKK